MKIHIPFFGGQPGSARALYIPIFFREDFFEKYAKIIYQSMAADVAELQLYMNI